MAPKTYTPPVLQTASNWSERISSFARAGMGQKQIKRLVPLIQQDVNSVKQGGQAMSGDEAILSTAAILKGRPVLEKQDEGGFNLLDLPGDAVKDIGQITTAAVPGLAKFIVNLPSEIGDTAEVLGKGTSKADQKWLKEHGYEPDQGNSLSPSSFASTLRNIAKTPFLGAVPGLHTAAGVTTEKGREDLVKHPVFTALDVLPEAILAGKAGAAARLGGEAAEVGSAAEAFAEGKPVKGTYRATVPEAAREVIGQKTTDILRAGGISPETFKISRGFNIAGRKAIRAFDEWRTSSGAKALSEDLAKLPEEELTQLYDEATQRHAGSELELSPEHAAILDRVDRIGQQLADVDPRLARVTHDGTEYIYPNGKVAALHRAVLKAGDRLAEVTATHEPVIAERTAAEATRLTGKVEAAQKLLDNETARMEGVKKRFIDAEEKANVHGRATRRLTRGADQFEKAQAKVATRQAAVDDAKAALDNIESHRNIAPRIKKIATAKERLLSAQTAFDEEFKRTPPASFEPLLKKIAMDKGMEAIKVKFADNPEMIDAAVQDVQKRGDFNGYLDRGEWNDIRNGVNSTWQELAKEGAMPIWVHNVEPGAIDSALNVKPLPTRQASIGQVKARVFDQTPRVTDIGVAMTSAQAEYLRALQTRTFINTYLMPYAKTWSQVRDELHQEVSLMRDKGEIGRGVDEAGALDIALKKHYRVFNPDGLFSNTTPHLSASMTMSDSQMFLPKHIMKSAEDLVKTPSSGLLGKALTKSTAAYKYSIMALSLKHVAHILFGGMTFLAGRGGLEELTNLRKAFEMVKKGEMPDELSHSLDTMTADQLQQTATGGTLGRLWHAAGPGKAVDRIYRFEEFTANVQRTMAYLGEESRAGKAGLSAEAAKEAGLAHAYKTLVDLDGMAPIERQIIRQVFPFYAFMRHTLKYVLTYPIDFPLRAAILGRMAKMENDDWTTGLPTQMQTLFFMGQPDAMGNTTGVEMKQFNPFRDTGSYFTLQGFIQSLNPALGVPFTLAGVDKFTGSPDLYPELTVDPKTGNLVAKRPSNAVFNAIQSYIPEAGLVDYFGGLTADMRSLKARDPEAYKARLWNMLFLPFHTQNVNKGEEAAHIQGNILRIAQQDVSDALKSGDTSKLSQYKAVPYNGELVDPKVLAKFIDAFHKASPGTSPRAIIPRNLSPSGG